MKRLFLKKAAVLENECNNLQRQLEMELENQRVEIFSLKDQLRTAKSERDEFQQQEHKENKSLPQRLIALWEGKTSERPERNDVQQQQEKQGTTKGDETLLNETEAFGDGDGEKVSDSVQDQQEMTEENAELLRNLTNDLMIF